MSFVRLFASYIYLSSEGLDSPVEIEIRQKKDRQIPRNLPAPKRGL
jgi:hypothetical protein